VNFTFLRNIKAQVVFSGFNVIQTLSLGLIFLIGTIMFTIFRPHFTIPSIGFALIAFAAYYGMNVIIFDYASSRVFGLLESGTTVTFENLQIDFQNDDEIHVHAWDSGKKIILRKKNSDVSSWLEISENLNSIKRRGSNKWNR
jgi:hypothetical protein